MSHPVRTDNHYLPHIDGLRALAICGVLLFHYGLGCCKGGFSGVDMFFCLSGFLITRNIEREIASGSFHLVKFYKKRFFRLHPSLTVTIIFTVFISIFLLQEKSYDHVVRSAQAALLLHANVYFHKTSQYFHISALSKPLLHTWSLSVEEQFYILWPIFNMVLHNSKHRRSILVILIVCSTVFACAITRHYVLFGFYELPARLFQFLSGSLTAYIFKEENPEAINYSHEKVSSGLDRSAQIVWKAMIENIISGVALSTVIVTFMFPPSDHNPIFMIPVTLSTSALIITKSSLVSKYVFSNSVLVHIGRLSYALYLVHWPVLVLGRIFTVGALRKKHNFILSFGATMLLSVLLQRHIENPFRKSSKKQRNYLLAFMVVLASVTLIITFKPVSHPISILESGLPLNITHHELVTGIEALPPMDSIEIKNRMLRYVAGNSTGGRKSKFVFIGDSFTHHLMTALNYIGNQRNVYFQILTKFGCPLKERELSIYKRILPECRRANDLFWRFINETDPEDHLVIGNRYETHFETPALMEKFLNSFYKDMINFGREFTIVGHPPGVQETFMEDYNDCIEVSYSLAADILHASKNETSHSSRRCLLPNTPGVPPRDYLWYNDVIRKVAKGKKKFHFLDLTKNLCGKNSGTSKDGTLCAITPGARDVIYDIGYASDGLHLSYSGSYMIRKSLEEFVFQNSSKG